MWPVSEMRPAMTIEYVTICNYTDWEETREAVSEISESVKNILFLSRE
jgi:hypothetical protein